MKRLQIGLMISIGIILLGCSGKTTYTLENDYLSRTISIDGGTLSTTKVVNKQSNKAFTPVGQAEFRLRISEGTDKVDDDLILTSKDFTVLSVKEFPDKDVQNVVVRLDNRMHGIDVEVHYELPEKQFYARKYLKITAEKEMTLERVDVDVLDAEGAYQPYQLSQITARGHALWKPGLGQPLYEKNSASFWGVEFPAATNYVRNKELNCGYLWGNTIKANHTYTSHKSVMGVADDYRYMDDAFYKYIDDIRIRPLRLQIQYNSWFDYTNKVNRENFRKSILKINEELVRKRDVKPLNAYVIDDGWQDSKREEADWSDKVWTVNDKFSPNFEETLSVIDSIQSTLGLWLSPGCFFGSRPMVQKLGNAGFESLELSMSMTGPKYMDKLEERILELTSQNISYFKFDGIFGHLNIRDFELKGRGTPAMPQLHVDSLKANDEQLNGAEYDELKTYYLVNGTERLIRIFKNMAAINPDVFIAITNGAYLSPWWLQYVDVVWMINAGDAAGGSSRTDELVYRDGVYYEIWNTENTKFPMSAIFNHEPKKVKKGEDKDAFKDYLFMNISRGTGFIELYIKTENLVDGDWDVIADGLKWARNIFPLFHKVRMHGGNPRQKQVYGYTAWNSEQGYVSIHNPSGDEQEYSVVLNRDLGLSNNQGTYRASSPIAGDAQDLNRHSYGYGDTLSLALKPQEIRIIGFDKTGTGN